MHEEVAVTSGEGNGFMEVSKEGLKGGSTNKGSVRYWCKREGGRNHST